MIYQELLAQIAKKFNEENIPYVVIGGQAVLIHGEIRQTRDIDFTLGVDINESQRIISALTSINIFPAMEDMQEWLEKTMTLICVDEFSKIKIDLLFSWTDFEKDCIDEAIKIKMENVDVNFISKENLVVAKLFAGRPQDINDARGVLLMNEDLNIEDVKKKLEYLQTFKELNLIGEFEKILNDIKK